MLFGTVIYDADFNAWLNTGPDHDGGYAGIVSGMSPEHRLDLCITVGAHPWENMPYLALDPMTDYVTGLATFYRDNAPSWMVPRFEGVNEQWNFAGGFYGTRYGWSKGWIHWSTFFDQDNFQGKIISTLGQAVLYQISESVTLLGFSNQRRADSTWRTREVRHVAPATSS
jgi:hypothetical protein